MTRLTIHNPGNDAHFMRVRPVAATVRVSRGGGLLAETRAALRVLETGRDVYDPVLYVPEADVAAPLDPVPGKSTHCPLKGDCSYFAFHGEEIAWSYDRPFEWSAMLKGHIAFYANKVTIEETGKDAPV
ncbi:MAG: DUF427 domain-containing protein [Oricola sp.]